jgi:membrane fusion protein (multidrug efflux system)
VDFNVPQQQVPQVIVGQKVALTADAFAGTTFTGKVSAINPRVDTSTRNVQIEATIANPKKLLLPGMFATVKLDTGEAQRYLTLPQTALTYNPYGTTVFVVKPSDKKDAKGQPVLVAEQGFVTPGPTRGDQVAILKGVDEGTRVVTSGQGKLKNGTPVVIDNKVQPSNNPNPTVQEQ